MGVDDRFGTVGNQFAARKRIPHADMPHRNAVIHPDRIKFKRDTARFPDGFFYHFRKLIEVFVPRDNINIGIAHPDERLIEIFRFQPCCI